MKMQAGAPLIWLWNGHDMQQHARLGQTKKRCRYRIHWAQGGKAYFQISDGWRRSRRGRAWLIEP